MMPPRLHEHRGSQVFLEQTEPEEKATEFLPLKKRSIIIQPIYRSLYFQQSVLVKMSRLWLGKSLAQFLQPAADTNNDLSNFSGSKMPPPKRSDLSNEIYLITETGRSLGKSHEKPLDGTLKRSWMEFRRSWKTL